MDPSTQPEQTPGHLEQLALSELDAANRQLADAGRTIDELRSDVLALATRVDGARTEAESFKEQLEQERQEAATLRGQLAQGDPERDKLGATIADLEAHVARLKKQLERPERLVAKKVLRRGPYGKSDAS